MAIRFRFRPRFRLMASLAIGLGLILAAAGALVSSTVSTVLVVAGMSGAALGALYLGSPAWKLEVLIDDQALEVRSAGERRFRLPWDEVVEVIWSPATSTCFVDGGEPDRSLLVPGDGAPAPYAIERRAELVAAIVERAPDDRVRQVEVLERGAAAA